MPERIVIAGGGISGLSTAWYLAKLGFRATIVEPAEQLGGLIRTDRIEGCVAEAGPDSFLSAKPAAKELALELEERGYDFIKNEINISEEA